ncbi:DUF1573 domain-containing protein [Robiginitalea sediminis]|uniref:DUF1573 domain-containing protein n=1 Tax=Robiginitalea sediminis TaxID=1982593 RepID=UPI000B4BABAA|nr:DUF1573 domain-containing protein [Robiginitalea sediminis]
MRKATVILSVLALTAFTSCKDKASEKIDAANLEVAAQRDEASKNVAVMTFDRSEHDFGTIEQGAAQETVFGFTNTGNAPLIITSTSASCGCTVPDAPVNQPIAPGETGEIKVKFNGSGSGQVTKTVTIRANTSKGAEMLRIKAFVNARTGTAPATMGPVSQ